MDKNTLLSNWYTSRKSYYKLPINCQLIVPVSKVESNDHNIPKFSTISFLEALRIDLITLKKYN